MHTHRYDVIIAGGGPAGLSAALMLTRARRKVLIIDAGKPRNRFATHMHGVLGHEGLPPQDLLTKGREEVSSFGGEFLDATITDITTNHKGLNITTDDGADHFASAFILATGVTDEITDIPGLAERWGSTVLHCPYCHGHEVAGKRIGFLASSPMSLHMAELLRQWSPDLTIFTDGLELSEETEHRLRSRGLKLEPRAVKEITGVSDAVLIDDHLVPLDAIFTVSQPRPNDQLLIHLDLEREESPFGSFLKVDGMNKTSHDRIWAVGNVVSSHANVPQSMGAGSFTGAAVNATLVSLEFDDAARTPVQFWEDHYAAAPQVWSGKVNKVLAEVASTLTPGKALDLGCGEGADVNWLAQQGWQAVGIDISPTAIERAKEHAVPGAEFLTADLTDLPEGEFDLVSASFFHSPVELARTGILKGVMERITPGGHLLITSHVAPPAWVKDKHAHHGKMFSPAEELEFLELTDDEWEVILSETRSRQITAPDGSPSSIDDGVVLVRRR